MKGAEVNKMSENNNLSNRQAAELAAAEWLMRFEDKDPSEHEIEAFQSWRLASPLHSEAVDRIAAIWGGLDVMKKFTAYEPSAETRRPAGPSRRVVFAMAASVALAFASGLLVYLSGDREVHYATAIGEMKTVVLPDGSVAELNTDTELTIDFNGRARNVRLTAGEAYFQVDHDPEKPFTVHAGGKVVTAVGTAFMVRLQDAQVDVLVTDGRVRLESELATPQGGAVSAPLGEAKAGQQATLSDKLESLDDVEPVALVRRLSWRDGVLSFAGESLGEVVADMSRYTVIRIDVEGEDIRALPIRGYFRIGDTDAMLEALAIMADLHVEQVGTNHVRLTPAKKS